jgi:hypothetical protein
MPTLRWTAGAAATRAASLALSTAQTTGRVAETVRDAAGGVLPDTCNVEGVR